MNDMPEPVRAPRDACRRFEEKQHSIFVVTAPKEHDLETCLHPCYAGQLVKIQKEAKVGDIVIIRSAAHKFYAELYIESVADLKEAEALAFKVVTSVSLADIEVIAFDWEGCECKFENDELKHVVRAPWGKILKSGFATLGQAKAWIAAKSALAVME